MAGRGVERPAGLEPWSAADLEQRALNAPAQDDAGADDGVTLLALFDRGLAEDARFGRSLASVAKAHAGRVRAVVVPADDVRGRMETWEAGRRAFDSFDWQHWPLAGVFRHGRLITSFHPRHLFFQEQLQEREEREQLEIFLDKMAFFDADRVKEQKNLELEARA